MSNYLELKDLSSYVKSFEVSNNVWEIVSSWNNFSRDTLGKQYVRAIDSISANIAEGFGRYHKKDKIKFYYYSFGSVKESINWTEKARIRNLISEKDYNHINGVLTELPRELHQLIKFTNERLSY